LKELIEKIVRIISRIKLVTRMFKLIKIVIIRRLEIQKKLKKFKLYFYLINKKC